MDGGLDESDMAQGSPVLRREASILDSHGGVFVFVRSTTCPSCLEAAKFIEDSGLSNKIVSLEVTKGGSQVLTKLDTVFVPVLVLPSQAAVGFNKELWNRLLKESAEK